MGKEAKQMASLNIFSPPPPPLSLCLATRYLSRQAQHLLLSSPPLPSTTPHRPARFAGEELGAWKILRHLDRCVAKRQGAREGLQREFREDLVSREQNTSGIIIMQFGAFHKIIMYKVVSERMCNKVLWLI